MLSLPLQLLLVLVLLILLLLCGDRRVLLLVLLLLLLRRRLLLLLLLMLLLQVQLAFVLLTTRVHSPSNSPILLPLRTVAFPRPAHITIF